MEIRDAHDLWGRDAIQTEEMLRERYGKRAQVACIGPSGEKLSLISGVCNDGGRIAARSGLGAVMGSKKLKAVVAAGKERVKVVDREKMKTLTREFRDRLEKLKFAQRFLVDRVLGFVGWFTRKGSLYTKQPADLLRLLYMRYGTPALTAMSAEMGDSPIKNWGGVGYTDFPLKRSQNIGAESVIKYEAKKYGCYSCPIRCGGIMKVEDGPFPIQEMHKPEYETLCAFGGLLLHDNLHAIFKLNDMVNRAGIDSISCGAAVAFAIECYTNGILTRADTGGLDLGWGKSDEIIRLTEMIINRDGLGDTLADGVKRAAEIIGRGSEKYAVHCGGVEPPMHDPKFDPGFAAAYACEPTPGRHTINSLMYVDLQGLDHYFSRAKKAPAFMTAKQRFTPDDKGEALAVGGFYKMLIDAAGMCLFGTFIGGRPPLTDWINSATGWNLTNDEYLVIGERIHLLRHAFNVREGLNPIRDFRPHPRLFGDPPLDHGPAKGMTIDIDRMIRSQYQAYHWDVDTGKPSRDHLSKVGLDEVAAWLYPDA